MESYTQIEAADPFEGGASTTLKGGRRKILLFQAVSGTPAVAAASATSSPTPRRGRGVTSHRLWAGRMGRCNVSGQQCLVRGPQCCVEAPEAHSA